MDAEMHGVNGIVCFIVPRLALVGLRSKVFNRGTIKQMPFLYLQIISGKKNNYVFYGFPAE